MTDTAGRDLFIGSVKNWLASGKSDAPFGDWYETTDGRSDGFRARPVAGGHLGTWCASIMVNIHLTWLSFRALHVDRWRADTDSP